MDLKTPADQMKLFRSAAEREQCTMGWWLQRADWRAPSYSRCSRCTNDLAFNFAGKDIAIEADTDETCSPKDQDQEKNQPDEFALHVILSRGTEPGLQVLNSAKIASVASDGLSGHISCTF